MNKVLFFILTAMLVAGTLMTIKTIGEHTRESITKQVKEELAANSAPTIPPAPEPPKDMALPTLPIPDILSIPVLPQIPSVVPDNVMTIEKLGKIILEMPECDLKRNLCVAFGAHYAGSDKELNSLLEAYAKLKTKQLENTH